MFVAADDADLPLIADLMNRAYRGAGASAGWTTETRYLAGDRTSTGQLRADLRANPGAALLKWIDAPGGAPAGCVWLEPYRGDCWYLGSLAADPARQNAGLGRTLLAAAEQWAQRCGAQRIRITVVNVRDTLIAWYIRRGYCATGEVEPFPYGDKRFGTPLRDDLAFVVLEKRLPPSDRDG